MSRGGRYIFAGVTVLILATGTVLRVLEADRPIVACTRRNNKRRGDPAEIPAFHCTARVDADGYAERLGLGKELYRS